MLLFVVRMLTDYGACNVTDELRSQIVNVLFICPSHKPQPPCISAGRAKLKRNSTHILSHLTYQKKDG